MRYYFSVSDIHGDFEQFLFHLKNYTVIDKDHKWSAGDSKLLVLGDATDRGFYGYETLSFIKNLQEEAFLRGGEVHYILGNHDALLLSQVYGMKEMFGNHIYNTQHMFKSVGGRERDVNLLSMDLPLITWLEECPFIHKEGRTLFQHCDSVMYYELIPIEQRLYIPSSELCEHINTALKFYLSKFSIKSDGYFMLFDILCSWRGLQNEEIVDDYLEKFQCSRIIHGHSVTPSKKIETHFGGKVISIDCEMNYNKQNKSPNRGDILVLTEKEINELLY